MARTDPEIASAAGAFAAHVAIARLDEVGRRHRTAAAVEAANYARYLAEVDPDGVLATNNPKELRKRVALCRKRDMAALALRSAQIRAQRKALEGTS